MAAGRPRIWFAGGGTGGHLFPALAVAETMRKRHPRASIGFVGGRRGLETRLVPRAGFPLRTLPLAGMKGMGPLARVRGAALAGSAVVRCGAWMLRERPDLVVGVGGYASGPAVLVARALRVRTLILEQNHFPGATNRFLAPHVDRICVPSEDARARLGGRGIVTGNPVRDAFLRIGPPPGGDVVAVLLFGGSRGARSLNRAMIEALPGLARTPVPPRIVHQSGADEEGAVRAAYERDYPAGRFEVRGFLDDMPDRLAAADLVVCRAGAMTLAEIAAAGRPAVLVPFPFAADDHQRHNAETLAARGAARVVLDRDLDGARLVTEISELAGDPERRRRMAEAARELAIPDAAERIADVADELLGKGGADVP